MADKKAPETKPASPPETKGNNGPPKPDFEAAAKIIREEIDNNAERRSKMNGDLSAAWKRVEDACNVNKKAAKDARAISRMSDETQSDYLRSLFGMMRPLGIGVRRDLVDIAEGADGFSIPFKEAPVSELEGGSVVAAAMRETAKADKAKAAPPAHPADDSDLADAGEVADAGEAAEDDRADAARDDRACREREE